MAKVAIVGGHTSNLGNARIPGTGFALGGVANPVAIPRKPWFKSWSEMHPNNQLKRKS